MQKPLIYTAHIGITYVVGITFALIAPPNEWYEGLSKPWFNPPDWAFPVAWMPLYAMIGVAGARVLSEPVVGPAYSFWHIQLLLNGSWSYVFFGLEAPGFALINISLLLAVILVFIITTWNRERISALLFLPYAAWVSFATILNATIYQLN